MKIKIKDLQPKTNRRNDQNNDPWAVSQNSYYVNSLPVNDFFRNQKGSGQITQKSSNH
ncbi:unnamed protein product [marine sediment metagenome]|uniref:Uncharacterized protein n=1 Tax=marine sediment metagenome TaxID=412755 RepID=X1J3X1_9ZZZZ